MHWNLPAGDKDTVTKVRMDAMAKEKTKEKTKEGNEKKGNKQPSGKNNDESKEEESKEKTENKKEKNALKRKNDDIEHANTKKSKGKNILCFVCIYAGQWENECCLFKELALMRVSGIQPFQVLKPDKSHL